MAHLVKLQHLCADYARAMAKRTVAVDSPLHVQVLLLPISLPPRTGRQSLCTRAQRQKGNRTFHCANP
jgi:hypothetical protein